jgi:hypothetical protein
MLIALSAACTVVGLAILLDRTLVAYQEGAASFAIVLVLR